MQKLKKWLLWFFGVVIGLFLLLSIVSYAYVSANKKSIIQKITTQLSQSIRGDVSISDAGINFFKNFPSVTVELDNALIKDSLFNQHHQPLFTAKQVFVRLSWSSLLSRKVVVDKVQLENATINIFTDSLNYTNSYLLQGKNKDATNLNEAATTPLELRKLELTNVTVTLSDAIKQKLYHFTVNHIDAGFDKIDSVQTIHLNTNILINQLGFNLPNGSFASNHLFEGKFDLVYDEKQSSLSFNHINILLSKQPFEFTGKFEFTKQPTFNLQVQTKQIGYNFARSLVTKKIGNAILLASLEKPFAVQASISGLLNSGDPLVIVKWQVTNNVLHTQWIDFTNCSFGGYYSNEAVAGLPKKDPNSKVVAENFSGTWEGFVFTSPQILINNLTTPTLACNLTSQTDVINFNNLLETDAIVAKSGKASLYLNYSGPIENNNKFNTALTGKITFRNAVLLYTPKDVTLGNCNGDILFTQNDLTVKNLNCNVAGNKIIMQGSATNLLKLVNSATDKINLHWSVYSPFLNLQPLTKLFVSSKPVKKITHKKSTSIKASQINNILTNGNVTLQVKADKLLYQKFRADNVTATISLLENEWILNNAGLQHADGSMTVSGTLKTLQPNNIKASVKLNMQNMDIKKVMNSFNNFGLKGITADNLTGKFYCNINTIATLNNELQPYSKTIDGKVNFSLKQGSLVNFEPIKSLQKFVFKNRDFDNVAFAELKDTITIKNEKITVGRMEIQSNVLSMFVEGLYDLKGNGTDLSIQVPLSNLKKRDSTYIPTNKGNKKDGGASVFIRAKPNDKGELKFSYDLFKRFRKK
ncbi:MAG: hypothetical protein H7068_02265 [Pedobacter sp.]|nr:hypothetical protein [Chitinophagaceae bacterium]